MSATTVTQYAARVHSNVYDTTWVEMRSEDRGGVQRWVDVVNAEGHLSATLVSREITTTGWTEVRS